MESNSNRAKVLMVQGTCSNSGKSTLVMGLCRIFSRMGYKVAPFKSQNMSLNSQITEDGKEIARSQVLQAWAANTEPIAEHNPVLLKPKGHLKSQIILLGRPFKDYSVKDYYRNYIPALKTHVEKSLSYLMKNNDIVIIEGAGSPAEINLSKIEIANMYVAKLAKAPVLLVGDIELGGVFASIYGTIELLPKDERELIAGFIINKFRGYEPILYPGIEILENKLDVKCLGIIPYISSLHLPAEDSMNVQDSFSYNSGGVELDKLHNAGKFNANNSNDVLNISIIRLPSMANFTDYDPLLWEPHINIFYSTHPSTLDNSDMIIIPGSKNTVKALLWMRETGFITKIKQLNRNGIPIVGICGGYQILGKIIEDHAIESEEDTVYQALGLLNVKTIFSDYSKITRKDRGKIINIRDHLHLIAREHDNDGKRIDLNGLDVEGYEIHMGRIYPAEKKIKSVEFIKLNSNIPPNHILANHDENDNLNGQNELISTYIHNPPNGPVFGTFLHGFWDNDLFRTKFMQYIARIRGKNLEYAPTIKYREIIEQSIDKVADIIETKLDLNKIKEIMGF